MDRMGGNFGKNICVWGLRKIVHAMAFWDVARMAGTGSSNLLNPEGAAFEVGARYACFYSYE